MTQPTPHSHPTTHTSTINDLLLHDKDYKEMVSLLKANIPILYIASGDGLLNQSLLRKALTQFFPANMDAAKRTDAVLGWAPSLGHFYPLGGANNPNQIELLPWLQQYNNVASYRDEQPRISRILVIQQFDTMMGTHANGGMSPEQISIVGSLRAIAESFMELDNTDFYMQIILIGAQVRIPADLDKLVHVIRPQYPAEAQIEAWLPKYAKHQGILHRIPTKDTPAYRILMRMLRGMTTLELMQTVNLQGSSANTMSEQNLQRALHQQKTRFLAKSSNIDLVDTNADMSSVGGLEGLRQYLETKRTILRDPDKAHTFKIDLPKGILVVGMPGCGKSLIARATAAAFGFPLLRLDMGRILGRYVGESEDNFRRALDTAEQISPCILWIDEIEKAFSGIGGNNDSGTTTRIFGYFLTWMQERSSVVYLVATANDISVLPPELLRRGRFDELFFVDLPSLAEREKILSIHLEKRGISKDYHAGLNIKQLAEELENYSGADLESLVSTALEAAFIRDATTARLSAHDLRNARSQIERKPHIDAKDNKSKDASKDAPKEKRYAQQQKKLHELIERFGIRSAH